MSAAGSDVYRATHSGIAAGVSRWASVPSALLCAVLFAFCVSLVPVSIDLHFLSGLDSSPARDVAVRVNVHKCEAHANPALGAAAQAFLTNVSTACGLTEAQFVATASGVISSATGMAMGNSAGISLSGTLENNLENLIAAADYPAWSSLTQEEQEGWGSQQVYDTVKFNKLMDGLGLGSARERFYDGYEGSGGGNFEWLPGEQSTLQRLQRIGSNWVTGGFNAFTDLIAAVEDEDDVYQWIGVPDYKEVNASGVEGWPSGAPTVFTINRTNIITLSSMRSGQQFNGARTFNDNVYTVVFRSSTSSYENYYGYSFYKYPFKTKQDATTIPEPDVDAQSAVFEDKTYYYSYWNFGFSNLSNLQIGARTSGYMASNQRSAFESAVPYILFELNPEFGLDTTVSDYPEEIDGDTPVYFPEDGDMTNWVNFITPPPSPRIENPYNPGNQTQTPEWRDETSKNVIPLEGIRFDKLFPFSLAFDLPKLHEKITENIAEEGAGYEIVVIPIKTPLSEDAEDLELDLHPLAELLEMTAPFVLILLAVGLLWTLIMFWKGILTGD